MLALFLDAGGGCDVRQERERKREKERDGSRETQLIETCNESLVYRGAYGMLSDARETTTTIATVLDSTYR